MSAPTATTVQADGPEVFAPICDVAIEQFDRHGFDTDVPAIAETAGVNPEPVTRHLAPGKGCASPRRTASRVAHRIAASEAPDPSTPTTMVDFAANVRAVRSASVG